jgi:hypothetical protein
MSAVLRELERVEHRVLGALEFVDATTGARIRSLLRLRVLAPPDAARFVRNPGQLYVLHGWAPLAAHETAFAQPPAAPAVAALALELAVEDPSGEYLPRRLTMRLPRDPNPANRNDPASLFQPQRVELMRSASARLGANWSCIELRVAAQGSDAALGGALIEVRSTAGTLLARGLSDWRGEALVPVAGVPVTTWSEGVGDPVTTVTSARVRVFFVPALGSVVARAAVLAGQPPATLPAPDTDALSSHPDVLASAPIEVLLAARRSQSLAVVLSLP